MESEGSPMVRLRMGDGRLGGGDGGDGGFTNGFVILLVLETGMRYE